ncbi:hypothetical protein ACROYT_G014196 [Oculina patagonica]
MQRKPPLGGESLAPWDQHEVEEVPIALLWDVAAQYNDPIKWEKEPCREKLEEKALYANVDDKYYKITSEGNEEVPTLQCQREEANGCLLLQASCAANDGYNSVLVYSEDTDVFIMSLALSNEIGASLFMKSGTHA